MKNLCGVPTPRGSPDFVTGTYRSTQSSSERWSSSLSPLSRRTSLISAAAKEQSTTPHPFAALLAPLEAALERQGPFLGEGGVLCAADCRLASGVQLAFLLRLMLMWPQGGSYYRIEEQLSELSQTLPLTSAWLGERMLPHLRTTCNVGQPLFVTAARSWVKKLAFLNLQPPKDFFPTKAFYSDDVSVSSGTAAKYRSASKGQRQARTSGTKQACEALSGIS